MQLLLTTPTGTHVCYLTTQRSGKTNRPAHNGWGRPCLGKLPHTLPTQVPFLQHLHTHVSTQWLCLLTLHVLLTLLLLLTLQAVL
jgi:hypothetical protein